jgi:hypothetical protein
LTDCAFTYARRKNSKTIQQVGKELIEHARRHP